MTTALPILLDVAAIAVLVLGLYFPRHRRADLVVAFLGVNIGVYAVSAVLATSTVSAGLGLGLFGVLSIIRLRSSEIGQREVAYYFASLAIGLITGLTNTVTLELVGLVALVVAALAVGDSRRLLGRYDTQEVHLDRAITDEAELRSVLAGLLDATVVGVSVVRLDLVNDVTIVQVRMRRPGSADRRRSRGTSAAGAPGTTPAIDEGDALALATRPSSAGQPPAATAREVA